MTTIEYTVDEEIAMLTAAIAEAQEKEVQYLAAAMEHREKKEDYAAQYAASTSVSFALKAGGAARKLASLLAIVNGQQADEVRFLRTANEELSEDNRLLAAERDRYRAERDGMWQIASRAETEHQRDQRMMYARED